MTAAFVTLRDVLRHAVTRFNQAGLCYGHGTDNVYDEAVYIVLEGLHLPPDRLEPFLDARLQEDEKKRLLALIEARIETRKPAPYLLNRAYMQGLPFYVDERVIVPRSFIAEILCNGTSPAERMNDVKNVVDICTGSGCLAILAAQMFPGARVDAVDLSPDALAVAKKNVETYRLQERLTLHQGDLFAPLKGRKYDLIITNPPYVDKLGMNTLPPEFTHEPRMALDGGGDGLDLVHKILAAAPAHLNRGGAIICEIGRTREALEAAYPDTPFLWLGTENSIDEVFWLEAADIPVHRR